MKFGASRAPTVLFCNVWSFWSSKSIVSIMFGASMRLQKYCFHINNVWSFCGASPQATALIIHSFSGVVLQILLFGIHLVAADGMHLIWKCALSQWFYRCFWRPHRLHVGPWNVNQKSRNERHAAWECSGKKRNECRAAWERFSCFHGPVGCLQELPRRSHQTFIFKPFFAIFVLRDPLGGHSGRGHAGRGRWRTHGRTHARTEHKKKIRRSGQPPSLR